MEGPNATDPAPSSTPGFSDTLEGIRAAIVAEGARKGLTGKVQAAILGILETLLVLFADFRAGRLAAVAPEAASTPCAGAREFRGGDTEAAGGQGGADHGGELLLSAGQERSGRGGAGRGGSAGGAPGAKGARGESEIDDAGVATPCTGSEQNSAGCNGPPFHPTSPCRVPIALAQWEPDPGVERGILGRVKPTASRAAAMPPERACRRDSRWGVQCRMIEIVMSPNSKIGAFDPLHSRAHFVVNRDTARPRKRRHRGWACVPGRARR